VQPTLVEGACSGVVYHHALFAQRDIAEGEELSYDYHWKVGGEWGGGGTVCMSAAMVE
jgi:hypothetical protein